MQTDYEMLSTQTLELLSEEPWYVAALSNVSALIFDALPDLNWAGFYLLSDDRLVVGPFQGHPACIHIPVGKGVCGTAVERNEVQVVDDVHRFPGHIACDSASNSEIVIPIREGEKIRAVLDIDSPKFSRFTENDVEGLKKLAGLLEQKVKWEQ